MYEVIFYENEKGQCPTDEFLDTLPPKVRAKLEKWIEKLEQEEPNLPRPHPDISNDRIRGLR